MGNNSKVNLKDHLLKAQIATLVVKGECEYWSLSKDVQMLIQSKYNIEPSEGEIEDLLADLWCESQGSTKSIAEIEEGFFEGY